MKKAWYNRSIREGQKVICIKECSAENTNSVVNREYLVVNGCMILQNISNDWFLGATYRCSSYVGDLILGHELPMPSPGWFSSHFALLT